MLLPYLSPRLNCPSPHCLVPALLCQHNSPCDWWAKQHLTQLCQELLGHGMQPFCSSAWQKLLFCLGKPQLALHCAQGSGAAGLLPSFCAWRSDLADLRVPNSQEKELLTPITQGKVCQQQDLHLWPASSRNVFRNHQ